MYTRLLNYQLLRERLIFRCLVALVLFALAVSFIAAIKSPTTEDFLSEKSDRMDDYCMGPIMQGGK